MPDVAFDKRRAHLLAIRQLHDLVVLALLLRNLVVGRRRANLEKLLRGPQNAVWFLDGGAERLEE